MADDAVLVWVKKGRSWRLGARIEVDTDLGLGVKG